MSRELVVLQRSGRAGGLTADWLCDKPMLSASTKRCLNTYPPLPPLPLPLLAVWAGSGVGLTRFYTSIQTTIPSFLGADTQSSTLMARGSKLALKARPPFSSAIHQEELIDSLSGRTARGMSGWKAPIVKGGRGRQKLSYFASRRSVVPRPREIGEQGGDSKGFGDPIYPSPDNFCRGEPVDSS